MFRHMHGVLNEVYLQIFLHGWVENAAESLCLQNKVTESHVKGGKSCLM